MLNNTSLNWQLLAMYHAQTKKQKINTPAESEGDYSDSEPEDLISHAEVLQTRGPGQFSDTIPVLKPDAITMHKLYPVRDPPLTDKKAEDIVKWQQDLHERKEILRNDPAYQFATLVAGNLDYASVDSLIEMQQEWPVPRIK